jgi:hypothetical protein
MKAALVRLEISEERALGGRGRSNDSQLHPPSHEETGSSIRNQGERVARGQEHRDEAERMKEAAPEDSQASSGSRIFAIIARAS